jgi:hypothetical protein
MATGRLADYFDSKALTGPATPETEKSPSRRLPTGLD